MRVLDLSMGWAGPMVGYVLGCLGADVIKVEDTRHFDWWRGTHPKDAPRGPNGEIVPTHEMSHVFNSVNRDKRGITLDLATADGRGVLLRLVAVSDLLVENFTPRVMERLGLGYDALASVNPGLVMLSMPGFGASGPYADYVGFGMTIEAMSGLSWLNGYPDGPPQMMSNAFGNPFSGLNGVVAALIALIARDRTGRGVHIELSQLESFLPLVAGSLLDAQLNGRPGARTGNRHPSVIPHGIYQCRKDDVASDLIPTPPDKWIALAARSDEEWNALCAALGRPDLADDPRFADVISRRRHEDEIDVLIAGWVAGRTRDEALAALRRHGVPAEPVRSNADVAAAEPLLARDFFEFIERAYVGLHAYPGLPLRTDGARPSGDRPAPCLGEHNADVLTNLLGLPRADLERLEAAGVIGVAPRE